jgi:hypothetical protein
MGATRIQISPKERHGLLTFLFEVEREPRKTGGARRMIRVKCDCGQEKTVRVEDWKNDRLYSCGCQSARIMSQRFQNHGGKSKDPLYQAWKHMLARCDPAWQERYPTYQGVRCDPRWETFEGFLDHQPPGRTFLQGLALARWGDTGDYTPENTRWATKSENSREMVERRMYRLADGQFANDVAKRNQLERVWYRRMKAGMPIEDAVAIPCEPKVLTPDQKAKRAERDSKRAEERLRAKFEEMEWGEWRT